MDMDVKKLHEILLHTFSTDANARQAAENQIAMLHNVPGAMVLLIQISMEDRITREIRQAAAVSLKNLISRYWEGEERAPDNDYVRVIPAEEKASCRQNVLEALFVTEDSSLRALLAESVAIIARVDFPDHWPDIISEICKNIQSGVANRIINALLALRRVVKNFEYRSDERMQPLYALVEAVFPLLLGMVVQLQDNQSLEAAKMQHLVLKTFWSCVKCTLPPHIAVPQNVVAWTQLFRGILAKPLPEASEGLEPAGQPVDEDERAAWPWWKLKKWVMQILCRIYTRYGNPQKTEEHLMEMSVIFRNQLAPELLPVILETLALRKNGRFCTDRVVQLCFVFLQEAVGSSVAYKLLKPHLQFLIFEVIHPVLCLTPKDLQLWAEDPYEFVRKTNDVFEDFLDPVYAASNLLADLCTKRGRDCLPNVLNFYNTILTTYLSKPEAERDYIQKDAAIQALCALDGVLTKSAKHKDQVEAMIVHHIIPEFKNPHGFLRLRACKAFSRKYMEGIRYHDEHTLIAIVNGLLESMFDTELPVRIEAAKTIRFVVMYPYSNTVVEIMRPRLPQILQQFFTLMEDIGNDEVVVALEHIIDRFGEEIGPFSMQLVEKFVGFFLECTKVSEEDEDASLAACSCLDAINTILMSIQSHRELYPLLVSTLAPIIDTILTNDDYLEYMESAIDILGSLVFYIDKITPQLWSLFPKIFVSYSEWAADYVVNFVPVIDNYVGQDIDGFLQGSIVAQDGSNKQIPFLQLVFNMAKGLFEDSRTQEADLCAACRLLYSILHNCFGKIDAVIPPIVHLTITRLKGTLVESTTRYLLGVLASLLNYNPLITIATMQQMGAVEGVFEFWLSDIQRFTTFLDRKLFVLGVMSILKLPMEHFPEVLKPHTKSMIQAAAKMLMATIENPKPGIDVGDEPDGGEDENQQKLAQLLDAGGYDSDQDAADVVDEEYFAILNQLRNDPSLDGAYMDEDVDDDYHSMLDEIDEVDFFLSTLQGFAQAYSGEYQSMQLEAEANFQQVLAVFAKEAAARKSRKVANN